MPCQTQWQQTLSELLEKGLFGDQVILMPWVGSIQPCYWQLAFSKLF